MSTLKVTHLQNESNSAPSISISSAVGGGVTFAGISTFHGAVKLEDGLHGNSTNTITASTNGSERLRIDSSGQLLKSGQAALTSTSLSHSIQVASASDANAIAIIGRAADDIGELSFYEADKSTKLGELQYRQDHLNFRHRVGDIRFATGGTTERLRISSAGRMGLGYNAPDTMGTGRLVIGNGSGSETLTIFSSSTTNGNIHFADGTSGQDRYRGYITYHHNDGTNANYMAFGTDDVERLRITSDGKLVLPTGSPGIQFGSPDNPAASGGIDISSQTLDDYEEGTWTPVIKSGTNTISYTGGHQRFHYTKIGSLVTVTFTLNGAVTSGTTGGGFKIEGLPFLSKNISNLRTIGTIFNYYGSGLRASAWPNFVHLDSNSTTVDIYTKTSAGGNYDRDTVGNVGSDTYVMWQVTYETAA